MISSINAQNVPHDAAHLSVLDKKYTSKKQMVMRLLESGNSSFSKIQSNGLAKGTTDALHKNAAASGHIDTFA